MTDKPHYIKPDQLRIGLYVHLDLGWMSHPFPLSSFKIASADQLLILRRLGLTQVRWSPAKSDLSLQAQPEALRLYERLGYRDAWVRVAPDPRSPCAWTRGVGTLDLPSRHGEGRFVAGSDAALHALDAAGQKGTGKWTSEEALEMGIPVCLGNDGFSNAMWEEWKAAYLLHKIHHEDPRRMGGYTLTDIAIYNNAAMARAFGGYGERVTKVSEIAAAIKRGIEQTKQGKPALLEFITTQETRASRL